MAYWSEKTKNKKEEKQEKIKSDNFGVEFKHVNEKGEKITNDIIRFLGFFLVIIIFLYVISSLKWDNLVANVIKTILNKIPNSILIAIFIIPLILFLIALTIRYTVFKIPKFDIWVSEIASRDLSTKFIWYKDDYIYIDYDRNLNRTNFTDFVTNMSDKSEDFTYYLKNHDINQAILYVMVTPKEKIPLLSNQNYETDIFWNYIPMGDAVNHSLNSITPIGWYLNDNNERDDVIHTNPSTSLLISGGTGSGKSVAQQCIIEHISRFPDNFMLGGIDCKQVEFNSFIGVPGVKKISLDQESGAQLLNQMRQIMYQRFAFMKEQNKNNVYKIDENTKVDYYTINGKDYQFDELFPVFVKEYPKDRRGNVDTSAEPIENEVVLTIKEIFERVEQGEELEINEEYQRL